VSGRQDREKRKQERIQAESKVDAKDRRTRLLQFGAGAVFLVIAAVVVLIVASSNGSKSGGDASNLKEVSTVENLLKGIPQSGLTLGDPKAPVALNEYGDLQCPICKEYSEEFLPSIIEGQVKEGQVKITFHNFVIISEQSYPAGQAALAAGAQGRGWNYIELFYRNQGEERSGYVTNEFMTSIAKGAGVEDIPTWNKERNSSKFVQEVEATTKEAQDKYEFSGTPSFTIRGPSTNGTEILSNPESVGEFEDAINEAS
jgi:protein-disulfide isomerase